MLSRPREASEGFWPIEIVDAMKSHYTLVDSQSYTKYIYLYNR